MICCERTITFAFSYLMCFSRLGSLLLSKTKLQKPQICLCLHYDVGLIALMTVAIDDRIVLTFRHIRDLWGDRNKKFTILLAFFIRKKELKKFLSNGGSRSMEKMWRISIRSKFNEKTIEAPLNAVKSSAVYKHFTGLS